LLEQRTNNSPKIVVGGIIYQNKKILICQRKEEGDHPLKWEFPGGKLKDNENKQEALKRELKEELNIYVKESKFFDSYYFRYKRKSQTIYLYFFLVSKFEGIIKNLVHKKMKWIDIADIKNYDFLEGDQKIISNLYKYKFEKLL
jgi:8-oxo-dGTP diphosphatase